MPKAEANAVAFRNKANIHAQKKIILSREHFSDSCSTFLFDFHRRFHTPRACLAFQTSYGHMPRVFRYFPSHLALTKKKKKKSYRVKLHWIFAYIRRVSLYAAVGFGSSSLLLCLFLFLYFYFLFIDLSAHGVNAIIDLNRFFCVRVCVSYMPSEDRKT